MQFLFFEGRMLSIKKLIAWLLLMLAACLAYSFLFGFIGSFFTSKPTDEFGGLYIFIILYWFFPKFFILTGIPIAVSLAIPLGALKENKGWKTAKNFFRIFGLSMALILHVYLIFSILYSSEISVLR
ncbi:hypothetical protein [Undibacterium crateris]|uniref:hypothetical protein n=1 Tax=Undibacterium crateris TaxID=2528175 RepID=UPI00138973E5|nr:hypothetical protein [Undibacterium crateris]NDI85429.1 hypothetical protein [Undibacterium crateris]